MRAVLKVAVIASLLSGCGLFTRYQTPFSVEDPSIQGEKNFAQGAMISSTKERYWLSYSYALKQAGYVEQIMTGQVPKLSATTFAGTQSDPAANYQFWSEGTAYARSLCSDFFRRLSLAKAHRNHAKRQTNLAGGLVTAAMGLAGSSAEAVGGAGLLFSAAESSFDAYDVSFLVSPDLALMEALVRGVQNNIESTVTESTLTYPSDVIIALNEYVYPCTFTGMKVLLDDSLQDRLNESGYRSIFGRSSTGGGGDSE